MGGTRLVCHPVAVTQTKASFVNDSENICTMKIVRNGF